MGIELKNVRKGFGEVKALDDITVTFESGKIYGLLGRNGAGKTTMMNLISNRIFASSGEITLDGESVSDNSGVLGRIYMMSEKTLYPESIRVNDIFRWTKELYGGFDMESADKLCDKFGLEKSKKIKGLSTGYSSIYKLITALCVNADYILLDEPVLGLDAAHRELFYKSLLETYAQRPRCFIVSTHLIEEVSGIIEDVVIIDGGRLIRACPVEELLRIGYNITGPITDVDAYCAGREVLGSDTVGGIKTAAVIGRPENVPDRLNVTALDLQKLFVRMTEKEGK